MPIRRRGIAFAGQRYEREVAKQSLPARAKQDAAFERTDVNAMLKRAGPSP
jgi:hypothetical protein